MKIACVGAGPAGLYLAILLKKARPELEFDVYERNAPGDTFGWGVVFSDETLDHLAEHDEPTWHALSEGFARWSAIDVHAHGEVIRSGGHGFAGIARRRLLDVLVARAAELGVRVHFRHEVSDEQLRALMAQSDLVVAADGVRSRARTLFSERFEPALEERHSYYIWLGTGRLFEAFTFLFEQNEHGLFQVHAYRFDEGTSTFIVECDEATWRAAGFDNKPVEESVRYLEALFAKALEGHALRTNRSSWIRFLNVRNRVWSHENLVLLGDAAHTAHFSIGSGTKLAMEDSIALYDALLAHRHDVHAALDAYESERRPVVERTQKAALDSLVWFEHTKRYWHLPAEQFALSLLSRSKRVTWENLALRDPPFVQHLRESFARGFVAGAPLAVEPAPPPMFLPFSLRGMTLRNRVVVSPMCQYSASEGAVDDWHLVHLGSRAVGGAGLVMAEMTNVSPEGRITPGCAGMYAPEHREAWRRVVSFVHQRSAARIGLQLGHAGRKGSNTLPWQGDVPLAEGAWERMAPSPIAYKPGWPVPHALTVEELAVVCEQYVRAARGAHECGFDLLEVHMAHGYLLGTFLSPLTNHRTDGYGGSLEARLRFPLQVFDAVRAVWPEHKPMSVRLSATDWAPGGMTGEDSVLVARELAEHGCDLIDVSTGGTVPDEKPVFGRMWQAGYADAIRNEVRIATMAVGNIVSADQVNTLVASGRADLCAMARPHLNDPYWTLHAGVEQGYVDPAWPAQYLAARPKKQG